MSSTALRIIAIFLAVGAVIIGYIGYKTTQPATPVSIQSIPSESEPVSAPQAVVVVAAKEIAAGQVLTETDVKTVTVANKPDYAYDTIEAVTARRTRLPIRAGDLVLDEHFHKISPVVAAIGPKQRAIAIRVDEVTGAGGFIEPGDHVDVLLFLPAGQENRKTSSAQRILTDVRVLAYGDDIHHLDRQAIEQKASLNTSTAVEKPARSSHDEVSGKRSKTALLAVAETKLSALLLAESSGRLRLALVGDGIEQSSNNALTSVLEQQTLNQQWVTLDAFKPRLQSQPTTAHNKRSQATPMDRVTILRGTQRSTVSVSRED